MAKRKYSDREKAAYLLALQANRGNLLKTSRETGVPYKTIGSWRDGLGVNPDIAVICEEKKGDLADSFERVARRFVGALEDVSIEKARVTELSIVAGTAVDKMRLLRDQPTTITQGDLTVSIKELAEQLARRHGRPVAEAEIELTRRLKAAS